MKKTILIAILFWILTPDLLAQKFNKVETTSIDSIYSYTANYRTEIEFKLDEEGKTLLIKEGGEKPVLIRFDEVCYRRSGTYLITLGKPDYFIINDNYVLHHREYNTEFGVIIIRNKYFNDLIKI